MVTAPRRRYQEQGSFHRASSSCNESVAQVASKATASIKAVIKHMCLVHEREVRKGASRDVDCTSSSKSASSVGLTCKRG